MSEIYVAGLSERWSSVWLVGAEAGMSVGDDTLQYGFAGGGLVAAGEPATFELAELSAGARLSMTFAQAAGLRGELGIGFSLLVVTPAADVTPESTTSLRAAFVELQLSRPFWIHSFGIAPGIGGRVFSAARKVRVDGKDRLALPLAAPAVELSLIYRP